MFVSVVICTYNGERFVRKQIESILHQTVAVDEIIIYDDHSTDKTLGILQEYQKLYPQLIILHQQGKNRGVVKNFEQAIQQCKGDIIFLSDQDDIWYPYKVQVILDYFEDNGYAALVFTDGDLIDESGNSLKRTLWQAWEFNSYWQDRWSINDLAFDDLVRGKNKVTGATVAFRSELKKHIFPFRTIAVYFHDAWLALYAAKQQGLFFIEQPLIQYRVHAKQLVGIGNGITYAKQKTSVKNFARKVKQRLQKFVK